MKRKTIEGLSDIVTDCLSGWEVANHQEQMYQRELLEMIAQAVAPAEFRAWKRRFASTDAHVLTIAGKSPADLLTPSFVGGINADVPDSFFASTGPRLLAHSCDTCGHDIATTSVAVGSQMPVVTITHNADGSHLVTTEHTEATGSTVEAMPGE